MISQKTLIGIGLWILLLAAPASAEEQTLMDELQNLITDGTVNLSFRYRFEFVDQDGFDEDAEASTLQTRLTLQSGDFRDFDFLIEFNDVHEIYWDNYNQGGGNTPNRVEYPLVPDPDGAELNQGYVNYTGVENLNLRLGRQRINLDNQRWVGAVGWRQQEQTFDAFRGDYRLFDKIDIFYSYVTEVHRIFGDNVRAGKDNQDNTQFVNVSGDTPLGKLVGYYYHYDTDDRNIDQTPLPSFSSATTGIRLAGGHPINEEWKVSWEAEFASQTDIGNNPNNFTNEYLHLAVGANYDIYEALIGYESLGGDDNSLRNEALQTPLATLHKFNGWADVFLTTPAGGLDDTYLKLQVVPGDFLINAIYHNFEAESGSVDYGNELDLQVGYAFNKRFRGDLFYANFDGDDFGDTTKFWFMMTLKL